MDFFRQEANNFNALSMPSGYMLECKQNTYKQCPNQRTVKGQRGAPTDVPIVLKEGETCFKYYVPVHTGACKMLMIKASIKNS